MNRKYLKITNKDGKVWLMPKQHMKTGLDNLEIRMVITSCGELDLFANAGRSVCGRVYFFGGMQNADLPDFDQQCACCSG